MSPSQKIPPTSGVLWLASYPKSGNTWARCFLEHYYLKRLDINRMAVVRSEVREQFFAAVAPCDLHRLDQRQLAMLRPAVILRVYFCHNFTISPCILKSHWRYQSSIAPITDRAVYLIRDPRDVAISIARHCSCTIDQAIFSMNVENQLWGNAIKSEVGSWSSHVKSWEGKATFIRYEDLPGDFHKFPPLFPEGTASVEESIEACALERLRDQEEKFDFSERFTENRFFGEGGSRWKDVLSNAQADAIVASHKEVMDRYGYL